MYGMYLLLCTVITGNDVRSIYIFYFWKTLNYFIYYIFYILYIEILADSYLCKCLKAIKCSESRVETLQIFFLTFRGCRLNDNNKFNQRKDENIS